MKITKKKSNYLIKLKNENILLQSQRNLWKLIVINLYLEA